MWWREGLGYVGYFDWWWSSFTNSVLVQGVIILKLKCAKNNEPPPGSDRGRQPRRQQLLCRRYKQPALHGKQRLSKCIVYWGLLDKLWKHFVFMWRWRGWHTVELRCVSGDITALFPVIMFTCRVLLWQAYASGCDVVILGSDFERIQIIPGAKHGNIQVGSVDCSLQRGQVRNTLRPVKLEVYRNVLCSLCIIVDTLTSFTAVLTLD